MPIPKQVLSDVVESDLQALINNGVREDRTLEFKRDTYGGNDDARAEFLADISALANTLGGDLIIGMDEEGGLAKDLQGMASSVDADQEKLRLTQIAQAGLQPRLAALAMHPVILTRGGHALVIRVGRSYQRPHRVIFKGRNRFWARSSGGKYEPDVDELRAIFSAAPMLAQRVREIRADRVAAVLAGETPIPLSSDPGVFILHFVPFEAAENATATVDLTNLESRLGPLIPPGSGSADYSRNFDGFIVYTPVEVTGSSMAYCQILRNGMVEVVRSGLLRPSIPPAILADQIASLLLQSAVQIIPFLRHRGIASPCGVLLTLAGVRDAVFCSNNPNPFSVISPPRPVQRNVLPFVGQIVPETAHEEIDIRRSLKPILDQLFQTAGSKEAPSV